MKYVVQLTQLTPGGCESFEYERYNTQVEAQRIAAKLRHGSFIKALSGQSLFAVSARVFAI